MPGVQSLVRRVMGNHSLRCRGSAVKTCNAGFVPELLFLGVCVCVMDVTKVSRKCGFSYFRLRKLAAILILLDLEFLIKF